MLNLVMPLLSYREPRVWVSSQLDTLDLPNPVCPFPHLSARVEPRDMVDITHGGVEKSKATRQYVISISVKVKAKSLFLFVFLFSCALSCLSSYQ